jgi:hypothetical protein
MSRRWRVVAPGFLAGAGLSVFLGLAAIGKHGPITSPVEFLACFLACLGPISGPLAEPLAYVDFDMRRMIVSTIVLLALIGLPPLRPGLVTGTVSGLTIVVWFFWGLSMTYYGV